MFSLHPTDIAWCLAQGSSPPPFSLVFLSFLLILLFLSLFIRKPHSFFRGEKHKVTVPSADFEILKTVKNKDPLYRYIHFFFEIIE